MCTIFSNNDKFSLLIACDEKNTAKIKQLIFNKIQEIVLMFYKPKFILKNLKNQCSLNDYKSLFLQTLVNFDRKTDCNLMKINFVWDKNLYLSSFYNFKLKNLKKKWLEICELTNENNSFLNDENVIIELMKFLMSCVNPISKQVNVKEIDNKIVLENEEEKIIDLKKTFFVNQNNVYELLLTNIINLAPKKVNVFCSKLMDAFSLNVLNNIYGDNFKIVN